MSVIQQQIDKRHKAIVKTFKGDFFHDFYDSIFQYVDYIEKHPTLHKIIEYDRNDTFEKIQQIEPNLSKRARKVVMTKIERYSLSYHYDKILKEIYNPIKEYRAFPNLITIKQSRGCALSVEEAVSVFGYLADILFSSIIGNTKERNFAVFRIAYRIWRDDYRKQMDIIHSMMTNKLAEIETIPHAIFASTKTEFDIEKSILKINGRNVKIKLKHEKPDSHYVLEYLFEHGIKNPADYGNIISEKFPLDNKNNNSMYHACKDIEEKVFKQTGITDFLEIHSGVTGWVQVNSKYP